jgi:hypothetical protein
VTGHMGKPVQHSHAVFDPLLLLAALLPRLSTWPTRCRPERKDLTPSWT